ncbi:MAG: SPOR domain-containing protein, partial [Acidobacteriota bacterium]|nr:SPOR domain-containing protein [Acidobacteriota bacterium]
RDAARARQLADQLTASGFPAHTATVTLGSRGTWEEVVLGRYPTAAAARQDLQRLQRGGAFADARVRPLGGG